MFRLAMTQCIILCSIVATSLKHVYKALPKLRSKQKGNEDKCNRDSDNLAYKGQPSAVKKSRVIP